MLIVASFQSQFPTPAPASAQHTVRVNIAHCTPENVEIRWIFEVQTGTRRRTTGLVQIWNV